MVAEDSQVPPSGGHHYEEQTCDGEVGKTEEQSSVCIVERGRTGDMRAVAGDRPEVPMLPFPSWCAGAMHNGLELKQVQTQSLNLPPGLGILLALGNDGGPGPR